MILCSRSVFLLLIRVYQMVDVGLKTQSCDAATLMLEFKEARRKALYYLFLHFSNRNKCKTKPFFVFQNNYVLTLFNF